LETLLKTELTTELAAYVRFCLYV